MTALSCQTAWLQNGRGIASSCQRAWLFSAAAYMPESMASEWKMVVATTCARGCGYNVKNSPCKSVWLLSGRLCGEIFARSMVLGSDFVIF